MFLDSKLWRFLFIRELCTATVSASNCVTLLFELIDGILFDIIAKSIKSLNANEVFKLCKYLLFFLVCCGILRICLELTQRIKFSFHR